MARPTFASSGTSASRSSGSVRAATHTSSAATNSGPVNAAASTSITRSTRQSSDRGTVAASSRISAARRSQRCSTAARTNAARVG